MTMKKMKNFMALLLALVMTMSLVACGNKTSEETKTGEEIGCYVQTTETGEKVLVDKDGKAVTDFTLDADGNVVIRNKRGGVDGCDCAEILRLIAQGKIDTTPLITHRFPLSEIEEAYRIFENRLDGVIKVAITAE